MKPHRRTNEPQHQDFWRESENEKVGCSLFLRELNCASYTLGPARPSWSDRSNYGNCMKRRGNFRRNDRGNQSGDRPGRAERHKYERWNLQCSKFAPRILPCGSGGDWFYEVHQGKRLGPSDRNRQRDSYASNWAGNRICGCSRCGNAREPYFRHNGGDDFSRDGQHAPPFDQEFFDSVDLVDRSQHGAV